MNWRRQGAILFMPFLCLLLTLAACACPAPTPTPTSGVTLVWIAPSPVGAQPGEEFDIRLEVDSDGKGISAGEISLSFNSEVMEVIGAEPGDLLGPDPLEGIRRIDNERGTVRYALGRVGVTHPSTEPGTFAILTFRIPDGAKTGNYSIDIISVGLADEKFEDISPIQIKGGQVSVTS